MLSLWKLIARKFEPFSPGVMIAGSNLPLLLADRLSTLRYPFSENKFVLRLRVEDSCFSEIEW